MTLEQQVTSLEISKRLKELGVKQEGIFDWCEIDENDWMLLLRKQKEFEALREKYGDNEAVVSAFTVAELGEMLPKSQKTKEGILDLWCVKLHNDTWATVYLKTGDNYSEYDQYADTEADARGKLLIYLLENNLLAP